MNTLGITSSIAKHIYDQLKERNERLVLAESCTGGAVAATMAQIPGVSEHFCGSLVTYRPCAKRNWLGVSQDTIEAHTTESPEVACEMAKGALESCQEATWSAAVVGHFATEPHSIFIAVARRTAKDKIKCKKAVTYQVKSNEDRALQQGESVEIVLTTLSRAVLRKTEKEDSKKRKKRA